MWSQCAQKPRKRQKGKPNEMRGQKKGIEAQMLIPPTQPQPGQSMRPERMNNGKENRRKKKKKETGSLPYLNYLGPFGRLIRPAGIIQWMFRESRGIYYYYHYYCYY